MEPQTMADNRLIRVGAVSYLNSRPLLFGLTHLAVRKTITLETAYPSQIADMLRSGAIDIGLVPVATIPFLPEYYIDADYCIGATGPVASVCLYSHVPLHQVETVLLDYQSRTSVALVQVLLKNFWKHAPVLANAKPGYEETIGGTTAGVIIGDRALEYHDFFPYRYDLAEAWIAYTGLPFVFAAWVANKSLPQSFIEEFNHANAYGLDRLQEVARENPFPFYDPLKYFTENISYTLDENKRRGLHRFMEELQQLQPVGTPI